MKVQDRRGMASIGSLRGGQHLAAILLAGMALALGGCAQSMSEFAAASPTASPAAANSAPLALGQPQPVTADHTSVASVARPAVLVEETTVPLPRKGTPPMTLAPPLPAPPLPAPPQQTVSAAGRVDTSGYPNLNRVPEQPQGKLLSPEEKAKVIAELEALAKGQDAAGAAKAKKSAKCATETLKPADRLKGETRRGEC